MSTALDILTADTPHIRPTITPALARYMKSYGRIIYRPETGAVVLTTNGHSLVCYDRAAVLDIPANPDADRSLEVLIRMPDGEWEPEFRRRGLTGFQDATRAVILDADRALEAPGRTYVEVFSRMTGDLDNANRTARTMRSDAEHMTASMRADRRAKELAKAERDIARRADIGFHAVGYRRHDAKLSTATDGRLITAVLGLMGARRGTMALPADQLQPACIPGPKGAFALVMPFRC
jgi:hypothetical protein